MAPTPDQMRATCEAYVAAYRANDKDALLALFAEDCEWTDPVGTKTQLSLPNDGAEGFSPDARGHRGRSRLPAVRFVQTETELARRRGVGARPVRPAVRSGTCCDRRRRGSNWLSSRNHLGRALIGGCLVRGFAQSPTRSS